LFRHSTKSWRHEAKSIFHWYAVNKMGDFANIDACLIVMEARGGANYRARQFIDLGHPVKLIAPEYLKAYVKGNKNDYNGAEAIALQ
jgi:transposase